MFKKTLENPQFDLFSTPSTQMGKREAKKYDDPHRWHNLFYANVTSKIDETVFSLLFKEGNMGAPNASIQVIIAMSVIKEGFSCSDEKLFEKCQFDLPVRKALGLFSLNDVMPSIDTYYLLRRRICEYENRHGVNLMKKSFEQLTGNQLFRFKISGKSVRQVKCYSVNITETCDDADEQKDKPNLIVNVQVKGASAADNDYLTEAINIGEKVSADIIGKVYADGAYQSKDNREFAEKNSIELIKSRLQGKQSEYDHVRFGNYLITTGQRAHENGLITDFRRIKSSILEKLFILIVFLFPRSTKNGNKKSTNLFLKLQIATF